MEVLHGIPVSPGIAIGKLQIIRPIKFQIRTTKITPEQCTNELLKLDSMLLKAVRKTEQFIEEHTHSKQDKEIFESQLMILQDPDIRLAIQLLIKDELMTVEEAVSKHYESLINYFQNMENEFFAQRASDFQDVYQTLMEQLVAYGQAEQPGILSDSIIFAREITPSQVSIFAKAKVKGICTEKGSHTSHCSILARSLCIPYIVAVPDLLDCSIENTTVIIDAIIGDIILEPSDMQMQAYGKKMTQLDASLNALKNLEGREAITASGRRIPLMANMAWTVEFESILKHKIDGIGLFRTEFLYLDNEVLPTEDTQFAIYTDIAKQLGGRPLIIRTFDLGGDKLTHILNLDKEENPYLGCRGIRFSLRHRDIFRIQIRAILRASIYDNIKIMFPMVIGAEDMREGRDFVQDCMKELEKEEIAFSRKIEIGAMIEIPSAALCADSLAKECDFFSIGTNDLVQYTLAVDRNNDLVAPYYQEYHPSVLALIKNTVEQAHLQGLKVSVCGEMASEPRYVNLLLSLGVDELSVNPNQFLAIKDCILRYDDKIKKQYEHVSSSSLEEIKTILNQ